MSTIDWIIAIVVVAIVLVAFWIAPPDRHELSAYEHRRRENSKSKVTPIKRAKRRAY